MKKIDLAKLAAITTCAAILFAATACFGGETIRITFVNPETPENSFWGPTSVFMQAVAKDLGIELQVLYGRDRMRTRNLALRALKNTIRKPHYLVTLFQSQSGKEILATAETAGVRSFFFNTGVPEKETGVIGDPRKKFSLWLGHMTPDDEKIGYDLADTLIQKAEKAGLKGEDGKIHIIGITGGLDSTSAIDRNRGLRKRVEESPATVLHQIVPAYWDRDRARRIASKLLARYPKTGVVWAATDHMALGVSEAIEMSGKRPGEDILAGGVDWAAEGMEAVREGRMAATGGGHFMEGGWVLVMLYDYHNGIDFADTMGTKIRSRMQILDRDSIGPWLDAFGSGQWDRVDFKKFSKTHNPGLKQYDFSAHAVLKQLKHHNR